MAIDPQLLARLQSQMSRADVILFTGAGFSAAAQDGTGKKLPTGQSLAAELWALAFPGEPFVGSTRLGDAFFAAKARGEATLRRFIKNRLSVHTDTVPAWYAVWVSMPWHRCYTVNIDDVELAVSRRFRLPRPIRAISATSGRTEGSNDPTALEVVHLNGAVWDELDDMTFSVFDYGRRLAAPDVSYIECATALVSRPVLVVGTELEESPLWQYLEARRARGRGLRELRPGSYLVTPSLNPARAVVLRELNADLITLTAEDFKHQGLTALGGAVEAGRAALAALLSLLCTSMPIWSMAGLSSLRR